MQRKSFELSGLGELPVVKLSDAGCYLLAPSAVLPVIPMNNYQRYFFTVDYILIGK